VGNHTVNFKTVSSYTTPGDQQVTISNGQTASATGTYTAQAGSLLVTISPSAAVSAGAQWRVDSGAWQNSGATFPGLSLGSHTVNFKTIGSYTTPGDQQVTISNGQTTNASGTYVAQTGSLTVTISPAGAITAGAQWRVDGGAWQNSGTTVSSLLVGSHTVNFKTVSGWNTPGNQQVTIADGQTTTATCTYTAQTGSLTVTISPAGAITAGAQWRVDSGAWQNSGTTVSSLLVGSHTVNFKTVSGWNTPGDQQVTIADGQTTAVTGTYTAQAGSLTVTISPAGAITAGAQWRVDSGTWQNSGATVSGLSVGNHMVNFKTVTGWTTPSDQPVTISNGANTPATGTYVSQSGTGSLSVTISSQAAIDWGAQWRVDGGSWQDSGATVSGLSVGSHTVNFKKTGHDSYLWPQDDMEVTISSGQTTTESGYYTECGWLIVTITPQAAIDAGAQWSLWGGGHSGAPWHDSDELVPIFANDEYYVAFKEINGWVTPLSLDFYIYSALYSDNYYSAEYTAP
jgi:hypothetical protein